MPQSKTIFHQSLHGYSDGHRLLSSSIRLPAGTEQTMLLLSDLSGHGEVSQFDEYITAYPLNEIGHYALAKTWYASEMPRPGCVWTHTLIIPFAMLASTHDLQAFTRLFSRPTNQKFSTFNEPIFPQSFAFEFPPYIERSFQEVERIEDVVLRLYESDTAPILIPVDSPKEIESAVFDIWTQQWPRLRRSFSFCTGAIAGRRLGQRWFDLQCVPLKRIDEVYRSIEGAVRSELSHGQAQHTHPSWLNATLDDLRAPQRGGLRKFLFESGAEADSGRGAFAEIVNMYIVLTSSGPTYENAGVLVQSLEKVFPEVDQGAKFKQKLLSGSLMETTLRSYAWQLALLLSAKKGTFGIRKADITSLAREAWARNSSEVIHTLDAALQSKRKPRLLVLSAIAQALQPNELAEYADEATAVITAMVANRPMLLADAAFRNFRSRNEQLLEYISNSRVKKSDVLQVLSLWTDEGELSSIERSARNNPKRVISVLLDILASKKAAYQGFDDGQWITILRAGHELGVEWVRRKQKQIVSDSVPLDVVALVILSTPRDGLPFDDDLSTVWAHLIADRQALSSRPRTMKGVMLRLYQGAIQQDDEQGARISTLAFPYIYELPMRHELSHSEWADLRRSIGYTDWWDWDWCRRLREGLIDRFISFDWPIEYFAEMIKNEEVGDAILDSYYYKARHKKFLKRLR